MGRYPPFGMLGDHPYSLGFHSNGYVKSSHGKDLLLLPGGYGVGDVIGCGYEYDVDQEVLNFFFTINGSRLAELPDRIGKISADEVRSYVTGLCGCAQPTSCGPHVAMLLRPLQFH